MVFDVTNLFGRKKPHQEPLLNVGFIGSSSGDGTSRNYFNVENYKKFWKWFKTRPELYSVISIPITDSIGGPVEFLDMKGGKLGRNKQIEAQDFWKENNMREVIKAIEFDRYLTGDGYGYKAFLDAEQKKKAKFALRKESLRVAEESYNSKFKKHGFTKDKLADYLFAKALVDEDLSMPRKFDYLASSTVQIISNAFHVLKYVQRASGREQYYDPEEIIHLVYNRVDGKVQGFAPVETMVAEMYLIMMIKDNMISFFENGGHPSKIYSLPDVKSMSDPAYARLISLLQESKKVVNSNGSLVYVGNLKVDDLGSSPKDLEYQNLAMWIISTLAFAYQIPSTRIPFILSGKGGTVNKGDSGGIGESGYWRKIESEQEYLEDVYNNQLFNKMGWKIHFKRQNIQDEVRKTQAWVQKLDAVSNFQNIARVQGLKMKKEKFLELVESTEDDFEEMSEEEQMMQGPNPSTNRQNQLNKMQSLGEQDTIARSNYKRATGNESKNP